MFKSFAPRHFGMSPSVIFVAFSSVRITFTHYASIKHYVLLTINYIVIISISKCVFAIIITIIIIAIFIISIFIMIIIIVIMSLLMLPILVLQLFFYHGY